MTKLGIRKLDDEQAKNIAVAYFCGLPAEVLGAKFGVCPSLVHQYAVGKYAGSINEDLVRFYRQSGRENKDKNASNLHINSCGFVNINPMDVLSKNEIFNVSGYNLADQLVRDNIFNPQIEEIAVETSFRYLAGLKNGYELLLDKVFGQISEPNIGIIELEFDRNIVGVYHSGDVSLEQVTAKTKRQIGEKIRPGALAITPRKKAMVDQGLETLTDRERQVLDMRFNLSGRYDSTLNLKEAGRVLDCTRERAREIESKALRKLRHPTRLKQLDLAYGFITDNEADYKIEEAKKRNLKEETNFKMKHKEF